MNKYRYILALDPSGSFYEGKGTTGYCLYDSHTSKFIVCGSIFAKDFNRAEAYWDAIIELIYSLVAARKKNTIIVCEDYLLYANKLADQINSRMETPKLIGAIQHWCYKHHIDYYMQTASEVKNRWNNDVLLYKGYIVKYRRAYLPASGAHDTYTHHTLDAIRHAIHYNVFKNGVIK